MRAATQDEQFDHDRDLRKHDWSGPSDRQLYAVAAIAGYCEGLVATGLLPIDTEMKLRVRIAETLAAFHLPSKTEHRS